jgi:hypothetical protein
MSVVLDFVNSSVVPVIAASGADTLTSQIRSFIAPFLLLAISIAAITFLFQREFMKFLMFLVIGLAVAAVFYAPELIANLGKNAGESNKNLKWQ